MPPQRSFWLQEIAGDFPDAPPLHGEAKADITIIGGGWNGNGVGPSVIGGRILASLALERNDEWSNHPLVGRPVTGFPPEPVRFLGAHLVRAGVASKETAEIADRKPSFLGFQLAKLAPAGLEDKY